MRLVLLIVAVIGCGKKEEASQEPASVDLPATVVTMPRVADAAAVVDAKTLIYPAAIVYIGEPGFAVTSTGKTWNGTLPPLGGALVYIGLLPKIRDEILMEMATAGGPAAYYAERQVLGGDDPPPPEPEEDTGGSGTTMVIEEGRIEGQYKMKGPPPEPARVDPERAKAEQRARAAKLDPRELERDAVRATGAVSKLREGTLAPTPPHKLSVFRPLVVAEPGAPATSLVDVLVGAGGGAIAVEHGGGMRVLATAFDGVRTSGNDFVATKWIEIHVDAKGTHLLATGKQATTVDRTALRDAVAKLRAGGDREVDVLVAKGATAQQLVDVLVALADPKVGLGQLTSTSAARATELQR